MTYSLEERPSRLRFLRNWISFAGLAIATASLFAFAFLFAVDLFSHHANPYMGILAYVVAPGSFFLGVGLVIAGFCLELRQEHRAKPGTIAKMMVIDFSRARDRKVLGVFAFCCVVLLFVTALSSYQAYCYTESVQFCGQACHTSMDPQFTTYQKSPHAQVECVACHVGPGTDAYIRTKINGLRQLYHTVKNDVERPVLLTADHQRPARMICEQCHWTQKYSPPLDLSHRHFLADETNTPYNVRLLLNMGGGDPAERPVEGIHWHMNQANKVEYIATDATRQTIPWVRLTDAKGVVTEFRAPDFKEDPAKEPVRRMDCIDCHNRPAHQFKSPNDAVDLALANGQLNPKVPWIKAKVVAALEPEYATKAEALKKIENSLKEAYPDRKDVDAIITQTKAIYSANFFPEMKADWRAHPDMNGHKNANGCFRCHDGLHKSATGKILGPNNCTACHLILSQGNEEESLKLNAKGFDFVHIDSEYAKFACAKCHTGTTQKE